MRSQRYAFIGRKQVKREMRKLWITRINAGARLNGISYSQLTFGLRLADIQINRKNVIRNGNSRCSWIYSNRRNR